MVGVRAIAETDVKILDRIAASVREHGRQMQRSTVTARFSQHAPPRGGRRSVPAAVPRTRERGRERPPCFSAGVAPKPIRRVAHAPAVTGANNADLGANVCAVCTCDASQMSRRWPCTLAHHLRPNIIALSVTL